MVDSINGLCNFQMNIGFGAGPRCSQTFYCELSTSRWEVQLVWDAAKGQLVPAKEGAVRRKISCRPLVHALHGPWDFFEWKLVLFWWIRCLALTFGLVSHVSYHVSACTFCFSGLQDRFHERRQIIKAVLPPRRAGRWPRRWREEERGWEGGIWRYKANIYYNTLTKHPRTTDSN